MLYCRPEFKMKTFLVACSLILALAGCRRTDVRSFAVDVPQATEADLPVLKASLDRYAGGGKSTIKFDAAARRLTLRYDSMQIAKKNIEMAIAGAGFTANGVTPESIGATPKKK